MNEQKMFLLHGIDEMYVCASLFLSCSVTHLVFAAGATLFYLFLERSKCPESHAYDAGEEKHDVDVHITKVDDDIGEEESSSTVSGNRRTSDGTRNRSRRNDSNDREE